MKKLFLFSAITILGTSITTIAQDRSLKKNFELKIPSAATGGSNGAAVAWHPEQKKYYAAMAGNSSFCLAVFDAKGKCVSENNLITGFDIRGLWYNPNTETIQMNGYDTYGWAEYILSNTGIPKDVRQLVKGYFQPTQNSAGAYDPSEKLVYFLDAVGNIDAHSTLNGEYEGGIDLHLGARSNEEYDGDNLDELESYNYTSIAYTNDGFIALLNAEKKQIELYSGKFGYLRHTLKLPSNAPTEYALNFSYSNGIFWLFDKEQRTWYGYN